MLSPFDDYAIHQAPVPVNDHVLTDPNAYERYWFGGFGAQGEYYFGAGLGLYPNRDVLDAHFSIAFDGRQHSFHVSRRAPRARTESSAGPLAVEVVEPMRVLRLVLGPNETGIECDLTFRARTAPLLEPRSLWKFGPKVVMDTTRFTQHGSWEGWAKAGGVKVDVHADSVGYRDRSWGVRPIGEREPHGISFLAQNPALDGARARASRRLSDALFRPKESRRGLGQRLRDAAGFPGLLLGAEPGVYWAWNLNAFDGLITHFGTFETLSGEPFQLSGATLPRYAGPGDIPGNDDPGIRHFDDVKHRIRWRSGTRLAEGVEVSMQGDGGEPCAISLRDPLITFHMSGIGYEHAEWQHGCYKGELVIGGESWVTAERDPLQRDTFHTQQVFRATMGDREGVGMLETAVIGPYAPAGFRDTLDGAP